MTMSMLVVLWPLEETSQTEDSASDCMTHVGRLVVAADDGGVPLSGALGAVNLHPEADQDAGRREQDLLAVLRLHPAPRRLPHRRVVLHPSQLRVPLLQQPHHSLILHRPIEKGVNFNSISLWRWALCEVLLDEYEEERKKEWVWRIVALLLYSVRLAILQKAWLKIGKANGNTFLLTYETPFTTCTPNHHLQFPKTYINVYVCKKTE